MFGCMFLPVTKRKYFTLPRGQFTNNECMPSKPFPFSFFLNLFFIYIYLSVLSLLNRFPNKQARIPL